MDKMKEPEHPQMPNKWDFQKEFTEVSHFRKIYIQENVTIENFQENYFNDEISNEDLNIEELRYVNQVIDLRSLISMLPKNNVDPSKIKIYLKRPRMMNYFQIEVIEEVDIDQGKQAKEYEEALKIFNNEMIEYEKEMAKYEKEMAKYDVEECQKRIISLEKELTVLKKKVNSPI